MVWCCGCTCTCFVVQYRSSGTVHLYNPFMFTVNRIESQLLFRTSFDFLTIMYMLIVAAMVKAYIGLLSADGNWYSFQRALQGEPL